MIATMKAVKRKISKAVKKKQAARYRRIMAKRLSWSKVAYCEAMCYSGNKWHVRMDAPSKVDGGCGEVHWIVDRTSEAEAKKAAYMWADARKIRCIW